MKNSVFGLAHRVTEHAEMNPVPHQMDFPQLALGQRDVF